MINSNTYIKVINGVEWYHYKGYRLKYGTSIIRYKRHSNCIYNIGHDVYCYDDFLRFKSVFLRLRRFKSLTIL